VSSSLNWKRSVTNGSGFFGLLTPGGNSGSNAITASCLPSGDQTKSLTPLGRFVTGRASPPSAGISQTWVVASLASASRLRSDRKAMNLPSLDHCGSDSSLSGVWVSWVRSLPS
jgi:hypothetical protein